LYETEEEAKKRESILGILDEIVQETILEVAVNDFVRSLFPSIGSMLWFHHVSSFRLPSFLLLA
jgi:hypothetical protein